VVIVTVRRKASHLLEVCAKSVDEAVYGADVRRPRFEEVPGDTTGSSVETPDLLVNVEIILEV
jgi:hypothetical protein|tara:strand:+ start:539 stop:727 length:189 start_codon:yes stop_codon:yes gene_type:complete